MLIREDLMQGRLDTLRPDNWLRRTRHRFICTVAEATRDNQHRGEIETPENLATVTHAIPNPANQLKDKTILANIPYGSPDSTFSRRNSPMVLSWHKDSPVSICQSGVCLSESCQVGNWIPDRESG